MATSKTEKNQVDPTPLEDEDRPYRTGPNIDAGLEPGAITVDPLSPAGMAAKAAREANGASTTVDDRVEVVDSITDMSDDRTDDKRRVALKAGGDPKVTAEA